MKTNIYAALPAVSVFALAQEKVDLATLHKIKDEAFQNSKVMETMFYLTDVNGPRLTNSPGFFGAADWVVKQMTEWGIKSHQEKWPFGRGWQFTHFSAHMSRAAIRAADRLSAGVDLLHQRTVTGEPMLIESSTRTPISKSIKGQLKGKIVLIGADAGTADEHAPRSATAIPTLSCPTCDRSRSRHWPGRTLRRSGRTRRARGTASRRRRADFGSVTEIPSRGSACWWWCAPARAAAKAATCSAAAPGRAI